MITNSDPYEHFASLYDYAVPDPPGMVAFYRRIAAAFKGAPVLEIGAGTGRVAIALAKDGHDVVATDVSSAMLAQLRRTAGPSLGRHISAVVGDQRNLDLGRRFPLVLITGGTLQHCLTNDEYLASLATVERHLAAGGTVAMDIGCIPPEARPGAFSVRYPEVSADADGVERRLISWDDCTMDAESGIVRGRSTFALRENNVVRFQTGYDFAYTYPSVEEMRARFEATGLEANEIYGNFLGSPVTAASSDLVIVGRRAGEGHGG